MGLKKADDGIFYMPYKDFLAYYEWVAAAIDNANNKVSMAFDAEG